jgi:Fe-S oxidoreductase
MRFQTNINELEGYKKAMEEMITVYMMGTPYSVPSSLTIMDAMEYAGFKHVRGCGCRAGFCGACATIYRIKGISELKFCLACQTQVENNMYIAKLPFFPGQKKIYDINEIKPTEQIMMQLYPEIYNCVGCNACTKACPQGINVMQYIAYAQRAEYEKCAHESFDCVACGLCSARCPAQITHPMVSLLARRLYGKYLAPHTQHLDDRLAEIASGKCEADVKAVLAKPLDEIKQIYNTNNKDKEK